MKPSFSILLSLLAVTVFCSLSNGPPFSNVQIENLKGHADSSVITLIDTVRLRGHIIESVCFPRSLRIYLRKPPHNLSQKKKVLPLFYTDSTFLGELNSPYLKENTAAYFNDRSLFSGLLKTHRESFPNDNIATIYKTIEKSLLESTKPKIEFKSVVIKKGLMKCAIWESKSLDQTFYVFSVPFSVLNRFNPEYIVPNDLVRSDGTVLVIVNR